MSIRDATPFRCGRQGDVSGLDGMVTPLPQTADSGWIFVGRIPLPDLDELPHRAAGIGTAR